VAGSHEKIKNEINLIELIWVCLVILAQTIKNKRLQRYLICWAQV